MTSLSEINARIEHGAAKASLEADLQAGADLIGAHGMPLEDPLFLAEVERYLILADRAGVPEAKALLVKQRDLIGWREALAAARTEL